MILLYFNDFEPNILIEDAVTTKKGQTLIIIDHVKFAKDAIITKKGQTLIVKDHVKFAKDAVTTKKGRTLIVKDHVKFAVELATQRKQKDTDSEVKALRKATRIVRRVLLKYKESHSTHFKDCQI